MKTTIDISDGLYNRCKQVIRHERTVLRALVEEGLTMALERHEHPATFVFSPVTFGGKGLSREFLGGEWSAVREEIYKGRGGRDSD